MWGYSTATGAVIGEEDDRDREEQETSDNQEDCEANGGTWHEDRQYCQTE